MARLSVGGLATLLCLSLPLPAIALDSFASLSNINGSIFVKHDGETKRSLNQLTYSKAIRFW
jgi:hypothetical protein